MNNFVQSNENENENKNFIEFSSVSAKQIEVLVAFLRAYQQYGKKPRSLMKLMIGLRSEIKRMLDISLINNGNNVRTNVLLAIYRVLMQLFLSKKNAQKCQMDAQFLRWNELLTNV